MPKQKLKRKPNMLNILAMVVGGRKRFRVDLRPLKGEKEFFSTYDLAEAETVASEKFVELQNGGTAVASISDAIKLEASKCHELLKPYGATLTESVDHYLKTVLSFRTAPSIQEIADAYIASATKNGRRPTTIYDLKSRFGAFARAFPKRQLSSITVKELDAYLDTPNANRTRLHYKVKVSQLFNFAIRKGWCSENPTERLEAITPEDSEITFFTVEETASILSHADEVMLPIVLIGFFAGLRQSELNRLDWSAIRYNERVIKIAGAVAKKRSRGMVTINETLATWIAPYVKPSGKLVPFGQSKFETSWRALRRKAGIGANHGNGMRHSFATYAYAATGDINRVCVDMRERDPVVLLNHYKGLVSKAEGERYFALRPAGENKVVAIG